MALVTTSLYEKIWNHNQLISTGKAGNAKPKDVTNLYMGTLNEFCRNIADKRAGKIKDSYGREIAPYDVTLPEALTITYGITAPDKDTIGNELNKFQKQLWIVSEYLKGIDVYTNTDTLGSAARRLGNDYLSVSGLTDLLVKHSEFSGVNVTGDIDPDHRFIIPELILAPIKIMYEASVMSNNWIASTQNISKREIKMPQIKRGNAVPRVIGESESIKFGTVAFGQKSAQVFKIGVGFKITDELIADSSINLLFQFLGEVGTDMSIGTDVNAFDVLVNGEQADASESAPVIGTENGTSFQYRDMRRGSGRLGRLKRPVTRVIYDEEDGLDIVTLPQYEGFDGPTRLSSIATALNVPNLFEDIFTLPPDQIMLLAPSQAMLKLRYLSLKTETRRNPQTQEDEIFVSDHVGHAILRRDGRLLIDKSLAYDPIAGNAGGFPLYMDVDSRISEAFVDLQGN